MKIQDTVKFQNIKKLLHTHSLLVVLLLCVVFGQIFHIGCIVKDLIGIPCPGCGLTRATFAFLSLDFKSAFYYHPLFWLVPPVFFLSVYGKKPLFNNKKIEIVIYVTAISLFLGVYIYRMLTLFPSVEPMTINNNSILLTFLRIIKSLL
jgi:hypothetical protein